MWILIHLISISGCEIVEKPTLYEERRISSPDGKVDAVLASYSSSLSSTSYYLFLVLPDSSIDHINLDYSQLTIDNQRDLEISWIKNRLLNISFSHARIFHFSNTWESADIDNWNYVVELKLNSDNETSFLTDRFNNSK